MPWRDIIVSVMAEAIANDLRHKGNKDLEGTAEGNEETCNSDDSDLHIGADTPQQQQAA
jgi:hypothetical protein